MAASASALSETILTRVEEIKNVNARAELLAQRLVDDGDFTAAYAYDHAEEELEWIAAELDAAARRLRFLKAYTATGEARGKQLDELAARVR